jgi:hypothetical protein
MTALPTAVRGVMDAGYVPTADTSITALAPA